MSVDTTAIITTLIPTAAGIGGLIRGVYTYKESQILKRQEILIPLLKEFESDSMYYAKAILDDVSISPDKMLEKHSKEKWENESDYYSKSHLETILRNHKSAKITDYGEADVRESFDALLLFFAKLEYLLDV